MGAIAAGIAAFGAALGAGIGNGFVISTRSMGWLVNQKCLVHCVVRCSLVLV